MNTINISNARRQANCFTKAQTMFAEGYTFNVLANKMYRIFKPGVSHDEPASYVVDMLMKSCTCPDFCKHGDYCKHTMFIEMELENDAANMEAQCKQWEEEEGGAEFPLSSSTPTVSDVLESIHFRICSELEKAEAKAADYKIGMMESRTRRVSTLECALEVFNEFAGKEMVGRLNLQTL